jgi:esterase/lipase superfamily enzyme
MLNHETHAHLVSFEADPDQTLTYGTSNISIPAASRDVGQILRPRTFRIFRLTLWSEGEDATRHFAVRGLAPLDRDPWFSELQAEASRAADYKNSAFLFVHGFATTFEQALFRTAQIKHDVGFDGPAVLFSWPSHGDVTAYRRDIDKAQTSRQHLADVIVDIASRSSIEKLHVIAHSMGVELLFEALRDLKLQGKDALAKIGELILIAPDVDVFKFETSYLDVVKSFPRGTLFASRNDKALNLSSAAAIGANRLGLIVGSDPVVVDGLDTIDVSDISTDFFRPCTQFSLATRLEQ